MKPVPRVSAAADRASPGSGRAAPQPPPARRRARACARARARRRVWQQQRGAERRAAARARLRQALPPRARRVRDAQRPLAAAALTRRCAPGCAPTTALAPSACASARDESAAGSDARPGAGARPRAFVCDARVGGVGCGVGISGTRGCCASLWNPADQPQRPAPVHTRMFRPAAGDIQTNMPLYGASTAGGRVRPSGPWHADDMIPASREPDLRSRVDPRVDLLMPTCLTR